MNNKNKDKRMPLSKFAYFFYFSELNDFQVSAKTFLLLPLPSIQDFFLSIKVLYENHFKFQNHPLQKIFKIWKMFQQTELSLE